MTQQELADLLGRSKAYIEHRLSPLPQWADHDFHFRDILGMPEAALRVFRDELNERLGEESRPIVDSGDRALLRAILREHADAAFVLRSALDEDLFDEDEAELVRAAALELMALLGTVVHRCAPATGLTPRLASCRPSEPPATGMVG